MLSQPFICLILPFLNIEPSYDEIPETGEGRNKYVNFKKMSIHATNMNIYHLSKKSFVPPLPPMIVEGQQIWSETHLTQTAVQGTGQWGKIRVSFYLLFLPDSWTIQYTIQVQYLYLYFHHCIFRNVLKMLKPSSLNFRRCRWNYYVSFSVYLI